MDDPARPVRTVRAHRLENAASQYLRDAAEQAIDWHPWGAEPFEIARTTGRPVLLDIGASWCHWCHVMDEGTYADPEVARLIGERFVAVKVDRDELPEIDRRYQRQVGTLTGEGGWPLTAFLTPSGETFYGGTYFPPEDGHGRPGFRRLLGELDRIYREEPEKVRRNVESLHDALERIRHRSPAPGAARTPRSFVGAVAGALAEMYDPAHGGFGDAPKFPHPTAIQFLLWETFATGDEAPAEKGRETLLRMADGGMNDQIGGGFHRYSVDSGWHIPHFEKMAIDNGALLSAYVDGARRFGSARLREAVRSTVGWVHDTLLDPAGGFAASQDADNAPGDDGRYFTWSRSEMREALDAEEFRVASRFYGLGTDGRMPHDPDQNVLFRVMPPAELAAALGRPDREVDGLVASSRAHLLAARSRRPTPTVDRARYAGLNGVLIGALAKAARLLDDPLPLSEARAAADAFLSGAYDPSHGVAHRRDASGGRGFGLADDNASFALGLVELAGATAEPRYANAAREILDLLETEFLDPSGLLRETAPRLYDGAKLSEGSAPELPIDDLPHLSPNTASAWAAIRLSGLVQDEPLAEIARRRVAALRSRLGRAGLFASGAALAVGWLATPTARVVIEGPTPDAERLERAAWSAWHPNLWVFRGVPREPFSLPDEVEAAAGRSESSARALVCFGTRCLAPISDPAELALALAGAPRPDLPG